jgi:hypothetical protein
VCPVDFLIGFLNEERGMRREERGKRKEERGKRRFACRDKCW